MLFLSVPQKEKKYWDISNKLTTFDYNWIYNRPRTDTRATTVLGIENNISFSNDFSEIEFIIRSYALLSDSTWIWMVTSTDTLNTIRHEQVHFNIEEICARRYRKKLSKLQCIKKENSNQLIETIYKIELKKRDSMHEKFDSIISCSPDKVRLNITWLDSTEKILKRLKAFSDIKVIVNVCQ